MRTALPFVAAALLAGCDAYVVSHRPPLPALALTPHARACVPVAEVPTNPATADDTAPEPPSSALGKARAWLRKWSKFDRSSFASLGVDFLFTYGVVSNLNVAVTAAIAWFTFCRTTGLSPLAPGQLKGFTAAYAAVYLSLGTILRPVRMALAVSATPLYARAVNRMRSVLPFRESRPPLNRTLAIFILSILLNVVASGALAVVLCSFASLLTGVPLLPLRG